MTTSSVEKGVVYDTKLATAAQATRDLLAIAGADGYCAISTAITDVIIGVYKTCPTAAGEQTLLAVEGDVLIRGNAAIAVGAAVGPAGSGGQIQTVTEGTEKTVHIIGRCVGASSAANDLALIRLDLGAQPIAALSA